MELAPASPTPIDPYERRDEWRFAVLVLALVASRTAATGGPPGAATATALVGSPKVTPPRRGTAAGRLVRPPRSC